MNKKKVIFWGVIITSVIMVFNFLHGLLGGHRGFAGGQRGHGRGTGEVGQAYGQQGGFGGHHQFIDGSHHGGFPWLLLLVGLAVLVLLVRWLRKRAKTSSMNQFIDTSLVSSHTPVMNQNASILDQWEKNI